MAAAIFGGLISTTFILKSLPKKLLTGGPTNITSNYVSGVTQFILKYN